MTVFTTICLILFANACLYKDVAAGPIETNIGIYGGDKVNITQASFMAQLLIRDGDSWEFNCGGSIIHEQFILTACHCTYGLEPKDAKIVVGSDIREQGEEYLVTDIFGHRLYSFFTSDYDMALIKTLQKLRFNDRVKPIKLADYNFIPKQGEMLDSIGFGRVETWALSRGLLSVQLAYVSQAKCQQKYKNIEKLTERMICAGGGKGKGTCKGDSGGPLTYKGRLIGVVSFGYGCGLLGYPDVDSYVPAMKNWIDETISKNEE